MRTRERILTIRLMEKVDANPALGKALGIEAVKPHEVFVQCPNMEKKEKKE